MAQEAEGRYGLITAILGFRKDRREAVFPLVAPAWAK